MLTEPKVWSRLIKRTAGTSSPFLCEEYCNNKSDVYSPKCLLAVTSCISFLCPCSQVAGATLAAAVSLILTVTCSAKKERWKTASRQSDRCHTSVSLQSQCLYVWNMSQTERKSRCLVWTQKHKWAAAAQQFTLLLLQSSFLVCTALYKGLRTGNIKHNQDWNEVSISNTESHIHST